MTMGWGYNYGAVGDKDVSWPVGGHVGKDVIRKKPCTVFPNTGPEPDLTCTLTLTLVLDLKFLKPDLPASNPRLLL
jgi:hypothetical protein